MTEQEFQHTPRDFTHSTWAMIVIVSDEKDGEFYVELEDPRYNGPHRVIAQQMFKRGDSISGWISKAGRKYLNKRVKELTKPKVPIPLHPTPSIFQDRYGDSWHDDYDYNDYY